MIDVQLDAGFESPIAFREAFARLLGIPPGNFVKKGILKTHWLTTPLGTMIAVADVSKLHLLEFIDRKALPTELKKLFNLAHGNVSVETCEIHKQLEQELGAYFAGKSSDFTIPLAFHGSAFVQQVWHYLQKIPVGTVISYKELATRMNKSSAIRAVARANGLNQIALIIPCHRVVGSDGSLTGYGGGLWRKQKLIEIEKQYQK